MKFLIWKNLSIRQRRAKLRRPTQSSRAQLATIVGNIISRVRRQKDQGLRSAGKQFEGISLQLQSRLVSKDELSRAKGLLSAADKAALRTAYRNLRKFHLAQRPTAVRVKTTPGIICEKVSRPIERVGLYVPGGSAPLFSTALMLGVPSQLAGNSVRVLCTPPNKETGGISPWILYAAELCGIEMVFKTGGAQAIAAMAYGTETIPKCDKIFGPGNSFVTEAKLQVSRDPAGASIDLPAGPSEVLVVADDLADPVFVAADLLSQAEHGSNSQVVLVTFSKQFADRVLAELEKQRVALPRRRVIARRALKNSRIFIAQTRAEAVEIANRYAPEHLILQVADPRALLPRITTSGSVFLGAWTPESLGDYASGTNHVLPTSGWARACSGLGLVDFLRTMTVQEATPNGLKKLGPVVERLALAENLAAHQRAVRVRLEKLSS